MRLALLLAALVLAGCAVPSFAPLAPSAAPRAPSPSTSPYAGATTSDIKALSPKDVDDLLSGAGMGFAKAAELNRYPGPKHALDMAEHLGLTPEQKRDLERVRAQMLKDAVPLGQRIVDLERQLDRAFANGTADEDAVVLLTAQIGLLDGEIRASHLRAHIATRGLLTPEQVAQYDAMRGYGGESGGAAGHMHAH